MRMGKVSHEISHEKSFWVGKRTARIDKSIPMPYTLITDRFPGLKSVREK